MSIGAVCLTLNARLTAAQLASMVSQSEASIVLVSHDQLNMMREICTLTSDVKTIIVLDGNTEAWSVPIGISAFGMADIIKPGKHEEVCGCFPEISPSVLRFTSGNTGSPKGVMHSSF